jgi:hypothetical protein
MAFYTWYEICISLWLELLFSEQTAPATVILRSLTSSLIIFFDIGTEKLLRVTEPGGREEPCSWYKLLGASGRVWRYTSSGTTIIRVLVASSSIALEDFLFSHIRFVFPPFCVKIMSSAGVRALNTHAIHYLLNRGQLKNWASKYGNTSRSDGF